MEIVVSFIMVFIALFNLAPDCASWTLENQANEKVFDDEDFEAISSSESIDLEGIFPNSSSTAYHRANRHERAAVNRPSDTRLNGRFCGELTGENFRAEVRAVNREWLLLRNVFLSEELCNLMKIRFKTTYKNKEGTYDSSIRVTDDMRNNRSAVLFVRYTASHGKEMENLEVFNPLNSEILTSLNLTSCTPPRSVYLGTLIETSRGVRSGDVTLLSVNTLVIHNFQHTDPNVRAVFWAGFGDMRDGRGYIIPIDGRSGPIRNYNRERVIIKLPPGESFYDIEYLAVISVVYRDSLGHVYLKRHLWRSDLLPPTAIESVPNYITYLH